MSAAGIQPRWKPWLCFIVQYFSKRLSESCWVLNHRVRHYYHERSTCDGLRGFYEQSVVFAVPRFSLRANFCKWWCFLQTANAVIEGACMFILSFLFFLIPAARLCSTALTTAGAVCVCVPECVWVLWSNNCGCVCVWRCCNRACVQACCVCLLRCTHCTNVGRSEPQYLSGTLFGDAGAAFRCSSCCRFSVQPVCSCRHYKCEFLLCVIYNCRQISIRSFLCNCGAGEEHCKPGDNAGCSGILQTSSLFQTLAYQIISLCLCAHCRKKRTSISVAGSQEHLSLFALHWFRYVYLRLAQEKHYF